MFGLSNRRTRFSSKVSCWGVGAGKVKLLLRKKRFKCQFELSKPLLTNKVILGSNRSNTHYFANPEFSEELKQITRHIGVSTFSFRSQFSYRSARKATAGLFFSLKGEQRPMRLFSSPFLLHLTVFFQTI